MLCPSAGNSSAAGTARQKNWAACIITAELSQHQLRVRWQSPGDASIGHQKRGERSAVVFHTHNTLSGPAACFVGDNREPRPVSVSLAGFRATSEEPAPLMQLANSNRAMSSDDLDSANSARFALSR